jgi:hypothetical protein
MIIVASPHRVAILAHNRRQNQMAFALNSYETAKIAHDRLIDVFAAATAAFVVAPEGRLRRRAKRDRRVAWECLHNFTVRFKDRFGDKIRAERLLAVRSA